MLVARRRTWFVIWKLLDSNSAQESFEINLRNRKDTSQAVHVLERHWGDWRVSAKSMDFTKADANTMEFVVDLKAGEARKVTYTVVTRW